MVERKCIFVRFFALKKQFLWNIIYRTVRRQLLDENRRYFNMRRFLWLLQLLLSGNKAIVMSRRKALTKNRLFIMVTKCQKHFDFCLSFMYG